MMECWADKTVSALTRKQLTVSRIAQFCRTSSVLGRPNTCSVSLLMKFMDMEATQYSRADPAARASGTGRKLSGLLLAFSCTHPRPQ